MSKYRRESSRERRERQAPRERRERLDERSSSRVDSRLHEARRREVPTIYPYYKEALKKVRSIMRKNGYTPEHGPLASFNRNGGYEWSKNIKYGDDNYYDWGDELNEAISDEMERIEYVLESGLSKFDTARGDDFFDFIAVHADDDSVKIRLPWTSIGGMEYK